MSNDNNIIEKINTYIFDTEKLADEFLPLKDILLPIQNDFNLALNTLKDKVSSSDDVADKVFYLNRYADLIKRVESIFDTRSKRLQQSLSMFTKLATTSNLDNSSTDDGVTQQEQSSTTEHLTPEQANVILQILKQTSNK